MFWIQRLSQDPIETTNDPEVSFTITKRDKKLFALMRYTFGPFKRYLTKIVTHFLRDIIQNTDLFFLG